MNSTDYTNDLLLKNMQYMYMNRSHCTPDMNTIWYVRKINEVYKFSKVSDSNVLRAFIIMPEPFAIFVKYIWCALSNLIIVYCYSQDFSIINPLDTRSIYMDGGAIVFFILGSKYHKISFINIKVLLQWKSTSVYTSWTYSMYHLELALDTCMRHFVSAWLLYHTFWEKYLSSVTAALPRL